MAICGPTVERYWRSAVFTDETESGWQQVSFAEPVAIQANTTYVASYHTDTGSYAVDPHYFGGAYDNAPLHALANVPGEPNGVFRYGTSGFPNDTFNESNYWVDVVLVPTFTEFGHDQWAWWKPGSGFVDRVGDIEHDHRCRRSLCVPWTSKRQLHANAHEGWIYVQALSARPSRSAVDPKRTWISHPRYRCGISMERSVALAVTARLSR